MCGRFGNGVVLQGSLVGLETGEFALEKGVFASETRVVVVLYAGRVCVATGVFA